MKKLYCIVVLPCTY